MDKSAIILAGNSSKGFNGDVDGNPLIKLVVDAVKDLVDEIIVVTTSEEHSTAYAGLLPAKVKFAVDASNSGSPLVGAVTGLQVASGEYALLLPENSPFLSREVLSLLLELCGGKSAVVVRRTSSEIEALHAVYNVKQALIAAKEAVDEGEVDVEVIVEKLRGVRYVSTLVIEQIDPDLRTFFRVNSPLDLKKAASMTKPKPTKKKK
ncbi:MAG: NTP transferase domain-containing protein [Candidatus Bathyarchaeota archaeon]|nr:NTP transferase domain-containing protein [Candidatus Bathyarchaeota archaeon]